MENKNDLTVPIAQFDTTIRRASAAFILPVTVYLGAVPQLPCPPVPTRFAAYACALAARHESHIHAEDTPVTSTSSSPRVINAPPTGDVNVALTGLSMKTETGHLSVAGQTIVLTDGTTTPSQI
jgi:hypothetical protein